MKWMSVANLYPPPSVHSKALFVADSSQHPHHTSDECLTEPPHPFGLYSVTRINPLYIEETNTLAVVDNKLSYPKSPEDCTEHCCKTDYLHARPLRDDALTVLKQNSDFIRSILVSVRLGRCHERNDLTPIPEGRGADCVPRPVWPSNEDRIEDARHDDDHTHKSSAQAKRKRGTREKRSSTTTTTVTGGARHDVDADNKSLPKILRELSLSINNAMENAERVEVPPEAVLQSLRDKINKCLDSCDSPYAECVQSSATFRDNAVATLSRAFSFVNAFNQGSQDELDKGRLMLLKRLGKFPTAGTTVGPEPIYEQIQRSGSSFSSTDTSTSGFSDLTHTPASSHSSTSESPPISRSVHEGTATPPDDVFNVRENKLVSRENSVSPKSSSAIISCDKANTSNHSFAYQIIQDQRNFNLALSKSLNNGLATKLGAGSAPGSVRIKSDTLMSSYPGRRCPDFTLDVQQAEMVMKKIEERKKERCWCRVITSFVGFAFLLFSVMFFSMILTRGEKMFGSL